MRLQYTYIQFSYLRSRFRITPAPYEKALALATITPLRISMLANVCWSRVSPPTKE